MAKDPHKIGKSSREKGARGERELAKLLRDMYGYDTRRGYVFYRENDVLGLSGVHIEVKRVEKLNISNAMEQAVESAARRQDGVPTVFHRKDREGWLVTMRLEDWIDMYGAWAE